MQCDIIISVARLVGQGVKTSPSHGENTSSILVLAARNFRSDSEVFCCLNIFLPGLCLLFLCKKTPQSDFFRQPCGVWIQTLEVRILILFTENLRKQVHRHQLLHFSILQSHITIQRLSLFFLIHFNFLFFHILRRFCRDEDSGIFMFLFFL